MGSGESTLPSMEGSGEEQNLTTTTTSSSTFRPRETARHSSDSGEVPPGDDPWWWEIENENLVLDSVPNVTTVSTENVSDDFNTLLKIGENVNITLSNSNTEKSNELSNKNDCSTDSALFNTVTTNTADSLDKVTATVEVSDTGATQSLEEFKEELRVKRMARQTAVQDLRDEIATLRKQLTAEKQLTHRLRSGEVVPETEVEVEKQLYEMKQKAVDEESTVTELVIDEDDDNPNSRSRHANIELADAQLALQMATSENISLRLEVRGVQKQVVTLKEVVACCKQMLSMKEEQCEQLKGKLSQIEESFSEREMKIMSDNLRQEYERQLVNIRQLRQLYEERQRIAAAEHENLQRLISIKRDELLAEQDKTKSMEERIQNLLKEVEAVNNELAALRDECNEHKFEKRTIKEEMGAVNTLFSQMVMGFNGKNNLDIDRLATMLEENRTLLNDMATKESSDSVTLPKLLFELVEQAAVVGVKGGSRGNSRSQTPIAEGEEVDDGIGKQQLIVDDTENTENKCDLEAIENVDTADKVVSVELEDNVATSSTKKHQRRTKSSAIFKLHEPEVIGKVGSTQEIIGNLPKVWKVLQELLSHHKIEQVQFEENGASEDCYKSVETPNGPKAELSVSKTYIKLKDLILEKKSLVKETSRLKTLNSHLDYRLNEQEKRLSAVSLELTKTWHLVGKMQRQHRQLHTQEQILRYQLQQKRRLLGELKDELEYCRRKWAAARAKNDESQEQYNDLRREFAQRKIDDANNSAESGYSDSGPPSDEEERTTKAAAVDSAASRNLRQLFEHSRKIKRMQSTSPGRASGDDSGEIELRWNSAPPTCGWRAAEEDEDVDVEVDMATTSTSKGAIPKRNSRSKQRVGGDGGGEEEEGIPPVADSSDIAADDIAKAAPSGDRAVRIQRLEEQCKSLIQQVLETSDNRERLEVQLCRFQDDIAPVQYAIPLDEFITKKRIERMTRASSAPATGTLTPREEEYTRKRSERLERLEEESRQLISRIKRTSDRGHYLRCSLDRLHRGRGAVSREGSFESNTEEESNSEAAAGGVDEEVKTKSDTEEISGTTEPKSYAECQSPLSATEEAYTTRRAERLRRLEEESKALLEQLARSQQRGSNIGGKLDALHEQYGSEENTEVNSTRVPEVALSSTEATSVVVNEPASPTLEMRIENIERISSNRDERLRILEEEGKQLISRLSSSSERGTRLINRIAEREQSRLARQTETPTKELPATVAESATSSKTHEKTPPTVAMLPTLKNIACSSIVPEELADFVTVTTTPSCMAQQGAIPKSKPVAQLCAARRQAVMAKPVVADRTAEVKRNSQEPETLEDMVRRLRDMPFPETATTQKEDMGEKNVEQENGTEKLKENNSEEEIKVEIKEQKVEEELQEEKPKDEHQEEHKDVAQDDQNEPQNEESNAIQVQDETVASENVQEDL